MELFTITKRKRLVTENIYAWAMCALAAVSIVLLILTKAVLFLLLAVIFGILWYFAQFRRYYEFETSYFDGEFRLVRIVNKSRRKKIAAFSMEEVAQIAPATDRSMLKYEREGKVKNCYSMEDSIVPYVIVARIQGNEHVYKVELDDRMLTEIGKKYRQKLIR